MKEDHRQRRRWGADTSARILDTARKAFCEGGVQGASMEEIAREAGVSKQGLYYRYSSREGLYQVVTQDLSDRYSKEILSIDLRGLAPLDALCKLFERMFELYEEAPELGALARDLHAHGAPHFKVGQGQRRVLRLYDELIAAGRADRSIARDFDSWAAFLSAVTLLSASFETSRRIWGLPEPPAGTTGSAIKTEVIRSIRAILAYGA